MNLVIKWVLVKAEFETIAKLIPQFQEVYKEMSQINPPVPDPVMQECKSLLDRMLSLYADFMEYEAVANLPELQKWKREYVSLSPKQAKEMFAVIKDAEEISRMFVEASELAQKAHGGHE